MSSGVSKPQICTGLCSLLHNIKNLLSNCPPRKLHHWPWIASTSSRSSRFSVPSFLCYVLHAARGLRLSLLRWYSLHDPCSEFHQHHSPHAIRSVLAVLPTLQPLFFACVRLSTTVRKNSYTRVSYCLQSLCFRSLFSDFMLSPLQISLPASSSPFS